MQAQAISAAVCPQCGTRLKGGFSRGLGRCMICLLRVGFDDAEESDETLFAPVTDRLGNYRIERRDDGSAWELGHGAMGVTYRAIDTSLQRPVALKLIASEWVKRGAEARERFMREARTAASLRHPNVATVYHFGIREENGQCFCAMELVEGETLETRVRRTGPLDALTTIDIALQVSSALAAAEKQGLVHRDLKPANLMLVAAALGGRTTRVRQSRESRDRRKGDRLRRGESTCRKAGCDGLNARRICRHAGFRESGAIHRCAGRRSLGHLFVRRNSLVSAHGTQTFRGRNHRTDSREPALASSADRTAEGGTCSKPAHVSAGVDACPRTSRAAECPCTHVAIAEIAAHRFSTVGKRRADWLLRLV